MWKDRLIKEIDPDKVAIYIRWSTDDQSEGTTLEVQMEACRSYIHSQGWAVNPSLVFIDEGWSGATMERPALSQLRQAVNAGQVDCVVVFKIDRLSRSVLDTVRLVLEEWEDRCFVKSTREPIDTTNQNGRMFFYMLTSYAEWERSTIRDRTMSGRLKRAQHGRNPGFHAPYGYRVGDTPGLLVIVPEEAQVVRRIFEMYSKGVGAERIARVLNVDGIAFTGVRGPVKWNASTIKYMLRNRVYVGELQWGLRTRNPRKKRDANGKWWLVREAPLVTVEQAFPAIVADSLFNLCQEVKRTKPQRGRGRMTGTWTTSDYLLTGLARCEACGALLRAKKAQGSCTHDYYLCTTRYEQGEGACAGGLIRQSDLDVAVMSEVRARFGTDDAQERIVFSNQQRIKEAVQAVRGQRDQLERRVAALEAQKAKLRQDYRDDLISMGEYKEFRADIDREQWGIQQQIRTVDHEERSLQASLESLPVWSDQVAQLTRWDELTPNERKHLLRRFIDSLLVFKEADGTVRCSVTWAVRQSDDEASVFEFQAAATRKRRRTLDCAVAE